VTISGGGRFVLVNCVLGRGMSYPHDTRGLRPRELCPRGGLHFTLMAEGGSVLGRVMSRHQKDHILRAVRVVSGVASLVGLQVRELDVAWTAAQ